MTEQLPALLDADQVAYQLGLSVRTVELRNQAGCIPGHVKIFGRHPRWKTSVILEWIDAGCPDIKAQGGAIGPEAIDDLSFARDNGLSATT